MICYRQDHAKEASTGPLIGYARVSTLVKTSPSSEPRCAKPGCTRIFEEKVSGEKLDRPELGRLLDHLRAGDMVTVTRLDRSTCDLLGTLGVIRDEEV